MHHINQVKRESMKDYHFNFRLSKDMYDQVAAIADQTDNSVAYTIRKLIMLGLKLWKIQGEE